MDSQLAQHRVRNYQEEMVDRSMQQNVIVVVSSSQIVANIA